MGQLLGEGIMKRIKTGRLLIYIILIVGLIITLFPFVWMILTSFKTPAESIAIPPKIFPSALRFENYANVWTKRPFFQMFLNTLFYAGVAIVAQSIFSTMAAYAYARIDFPGKNVLFMFLLGLLMVPGYVYILPQYQIIQKLGLLNTRPGLVLPSMFSVFANFMYRQFFVALPDELEDAARLDGCNHFMIYSRIMLPLIRAGMVAQGILVLRACWNDLMWPLVVITSAEKSTLPVGLSMLVGEQGIDYPELMAAATMAVLPLLVLYICFQKQFIEGIAHTGIKG